MLSAAAKAPELNALLNAWANYTGGTANDINSLDKYKEQVFTLLTQVEASVQYIRSAKMQVISIDDVICGIDLRLAELKEALSQHFTSTQQTVQFRSQTLRDTLENIDSKWTTLQTQLLQAAASKKANPMTDVKPASKMPWCLNWKSKTQAQDKSLDAQHVAAATPVNAM